MVKDLVRLRMVGGSSQALLATSVNPGKDAQKFSNLKVHGLLGLASFASKSGQWSKRDDERAWRMWVLNWTSQSTLQKNESNLHRVGFCL